jgi:hypothetical protein
MDDRQEMATRRPWVPWAVASLALVAVATVAYSIGAHRGAGGLDTAPMHWHHHGFGGIWLFLLLFLFFGGLRRAWWGACYGPWFYGRRYPRYDDEWEAWHRRAHERMNEATSPPAARPGSGQDPIT